MDDSLDNVRKRELTLSDGPLIRVQVDFIATSTLEALELLDAPENRDSGKLRSELLKRCQSGTAEIIETSMMAVTSGSSGSTSSSRETVYPTEYEAPQIPDLANKPQEMDLSEYLMKFSIPPAPCAFETRNIGPSLQIKAKKNEGTDQIQMYISSSLTYSGGESTFLEWKTIHGKADVTMPVFYSIELATDLRVTDGSYVLAGVTSPKSDTDATDKKRRVFVFARATAITRPSK